MTTKLTLTIEDNVIYAAKKYAQKRGKSLSGIVECYLKSVTATESEKDTLSPKIKSLMGSIHLSKNFDYKKELGKSLAKKYMK